MVFYYNKALAEGNPKFEFDGATKEKPDCGLRRIL
jgi:hypothetical protein